MLENLESNVSNAISFYEINKLQNLFRFNHITNSNIMSIEFQNNRGANKSQSQSKCG